jgi:hypothetical protein
VSTAKEQYFAEVRKHQNLHAELAEQVGQNLWQSIVTLLQSELPEWDVGVASEGKSQDYFSGIFRCINESTPIHCDWSPYDSRTEDWMVKHITRQGVFNLYLAPFHGGRTEIYDTQWTEEALQFRDPDSYGYWPELVKGRQKAVIRPEVGDLYFFNTRNMHQVFPVEPTPGAPTDDGSGGRRQRLTLSSFYGLIPGNGQQRPRLILWS